MNRMFRLWVVALLALAPRITLAVNDTHPCVLCVRSLTPSSIDLIASSITASVYRWQTLPAAALCWDRLAR